MPRPTKGDGAMTNDLGRKGFDTVALVTSASCRLIGEGRTVLPDQSEERRKEGRRGLVALEVGDGAFLRKE